MASIILGGAGNVLGGMIAGPMGAAFGNTIGNVAGSIIDNKLFSSFKHNTYGHRLSNLLVQTSTYGKVIPKLFGQCRISGNIIWSTSIKEHQSAEAQTVRGGKGRKRRINHTSYSYTTTLAIAICEGEIESIVNMWADAKLITPYLQHCRVYYGDEKQLPDPLIQAYQGVNATPAYRGLAYIVIENFPLAEYGNRIPNFTFEIKALPENSEISEHQQLEEKIRAVHIIPGSGEFVYDTQIQHKAYGKRDGKKILQTGKAHPINANNYMAKADSVLSLDQLERSCCNLQWVSPVVCWFATSLNANQSSIIPGVEHRHTITYPDTWRVSNFSRETAHLISYKNNRPIYGGTPNDQSVLRYLSEIKRRGLKIMFCPMLMVDQNDKPWRGHIVGDADSLSGFCDSYKDFILHYARLVKGKVDAFVIGSEFPGLTAIRNKNNQFPFVDCLIGLANQVKAILGSNVKIIYAADWSEYHHVSGGWYSLDSLWSSSCIDVIGINAYFPLTSAEPDQQISQNDIKKGWFSGEGYDYFIRKNQRVRLDPEYAWKNIEFWWNNRHKNPDGQFTSWVPGSKKIWFTEIGFASIDKTTNEPNVFYDPESSVGGIPKNSNGSVSFLSQRKALEATLDVWQGSNIVEEIFIWCWDARPYPFWPQIESMWSDGFKWSRGHWLNGKLSLTSLADILLYFCRQSEINEADVDIGSLDEIIVDGFVVDYLASNRDYIEHICMIYNVDSTESDGLIKFEQGKNKKIAIRVPESDVIVQTHMRLLKSYRNVAVATVI